MPEGDQNVVYSEHEAAGGEERSFVQKVVGIFSSPRETFESIKQHPTWLLPFLLLCVVSYGSLYLTRDVVLQTQIERIENNPNIPTDQADKIVERMRSSMTGSGRIWQFAMVPVGILVAFSVVSAVLLFGGNVLLGGSAKFKQIFVMYTWSSLISALSAIIKTPLILATGSISVGTSLAAFMPSDQYATFLYNFLGKFDVFSIWQVIVVAVGMSVIYQFAMRRSMILVGSLWFLYVLISAGLGALTQGMMSFGG